MPDQMFKNTWGRLRGKKSQIPQFLSQIRLQGIRGIEDLEVGLEYPVSVIAGDNASGKSTVLFAAACAYAAVPGSSLRAFLPSALFPDYVPQGFERRDERSEIRIDFDYATPALSMLWRRGPEIATSPRSVPRWRYSFYGRKGASQPQKPVYLRTLSNLSSPSEVRGVLSMSRLPTPPEEKPMTAAQIQFAQSMLPLKYAEIVDLSAGKGDKKLLFAVQKGGAQYSELHMAAGERAIIRLSQEIEQLKGALILIDEVETGLHPRAQKLLMLHLQRLALRHDLQVIVTTHSPVVLDAVPPEGRIFLERDDEGRVSASPPYRDIVQNALYGRSDDTLNLLCEDKTAEAVLDGVLDYLVPLENIKRDAVHIGRNTAGSEFPTHAKAFEQFGQIQNFIFILDGDQQGKGLEDKIWENAKDRDVPVLFLPGKHGPEDWIWERLRQRSADEALLRTFGTDRQSFVEQMSRQDAIYAPAFDTRSAISKNKLYDLARFFKRRVVDVGRTIGQLEAEDEDSDLQLLVDDLRSILLQWRAPPE